MAESQTTYTQISLEEAITDAQAKQNLSTLDKPWQEKKARLMIASRLAYGLLILFGVTIACSGIIITMLVITSAFSKMSPEILVTGVEQIIGFVTMLLPYIATPLGVALGYFFKEAGIQ